MQKITISRDRSCSEDRRSETNRTRQVNRKCNVYRSSPVKKEITMAASMTGVLFLIEDLFNQKIQIRTRDGRLNLVVASLLSE